MAEASTLPQILGTGEEKEAPRAAERKDGVGKGKGCCPPRGLLLAGELEDKGVLAGGSGVGHCVLAVSPVHRNLSPGPGNREGVLRVGDLWGLCKCREGQARFSFGEGPLGAGAE